MAAAASGGGGGSGRACFVLGASGETGRALLRELLSRQLFARVTLVGRRRLSLGEETGVTVVRGAGGAGVVAAVMVVGMAGVGELTLGLPAGAGGGGLRAAERARRRLPGTRCRLLLPGHHQGQGWRGEWDLHPHATGERWAGVLPARSPALLTLLSRLDPQDGFVRVDRDYVAQAAELARAGGCKHFVLQSSQGANQRSHFLYLRVKVRGQLGWVPAGMLGKEAGAEGSRDANGSEGSPGAGGQGGEEKGLAGQPCDWLCPKQHSIHLPLQTTRKTL